MNNNEPDERRRECKIGMDNNDDSEGKKKRRAVNGKSNNVYAIM